MPKPPAQRPSPFALLDRMVTEWPWQVVGDPVEKLTASRDGVATNRGAA
ncbi:hypothetical protein [Micromonospora chokoriensis]|nr:hypothetical protein [Micromonospora chokoriensis]